VPPVHETGAKSSQGGKAGLRSSHVVPGHSGILAERVEVSRMQAHRTWRTRLGFALFALAVVVLIGAAIVGAVVIRAFQFTLPTEPEDSAREARLCLPVAPPIPAGPLADWMVRVRAPRTPPNRVGGLEKGASHFTQVVYPYSLPRLTPSSRRPKPPRETGTEPARDAGQPPSA
jgi:hypothetical protein